MTKKTSKQQGKLEKIKSSWLLKEGNKKKCPSCLAQINNSAKKCHNCQKRLGAVGVFQELQAPLSVVVALLSISIVLYDKVESSNIFSPPNSEISVSPITWDLEKYYAVIVNEGERPGWILSSSMTVTIEISDDEHAMLQYPLTPSVDLIQPSNRNNLEQLELTPTNIILPRYLPSSTFSFTSSWFTYTPSADFERALQQLELIPKASPTTSTDGGSDNSIAEENEYSSFVESFFNEIRQQDMLSITYALSTAIKNDKSIKECAINIAVKNFNGEITRLTQNALLPSSDNQNLIHINSNTITSGGNNCSQFLSSSLAKIDGDIYREVIRDQIIESLQFE